LLSEADIGTVFRHVGLGPHKATLAVAWLRPRRLITVACALCSEYRYCGCFSLRISVLFALAARPGVIPNAGHNLKARKKLVISLLNGEQPPFARYALEVARATIDELKS
jgi:hypothetical protein